MVPDKEEGGVGVLLFLFILREGKKKEGEMLFCVKDAFS